MGGSGDGRAVGHSVCLWLFWSDADVNGAGAGDNGVVSAEVMVCLLPDGNDDAGNLRFKKQKGSI